MDMETFGQFNRNVFWVIPQNDTGFVTDTNIEAQNI